MTAATARTVDRFSVIGDLIFEYRVAGERGDLDRGDILRGAIQRAMREQLWPDYEETAQKE